MNIVSYYRYEIPHERGRVSDRVPSRARSSMFVFRFERVQSPRDAARADNKTVPCIPRRGIKRYARQLIRARRKIDLNYGRCDYYSVRASLIFRIKLSDVGLSSRERKSRRRENIYVLRAYFDTLRGHTYYRKNITCLRKPRNLAFKTPVKHRPRNSRTGESRERARQLSETLVYIYPLAKYTARLNDKSIPLQIADCRRDSLPLL